MSSTKYEHDTFISYSHDDVDAAEIIAKKLVDVHGLKVCFDKWTFVPGEKFTKAMSIGLDTAKTCTVVISKDFSSGWMKEEIDYALNRSAKDSSFRIIPVLIPGRDGENIGGFLGLRTWVRYWLHLDEKKPLYQLYCGIMGISPGRDGNMYEDHGEEKVLEENIKMIKNLHKKRLIDEPLMKEFIRHVVLKRIDGSKEGNDE